MSNKYYKKKRGSGVSGFYYGAANDNGTNLFIFPSSDSLMWGWNWNNSIIENQNAILVYWEEITKKEAISAFLDDFRDNKDDEVFIAHIRRFIKSIDNSCPTEICALKEHLKELLSHLQEEQDLIKTIKSLFIDFPEDWVPATKITDGFWMKRLDA